MKRMKVERPNGDLISVDVVSEQEATWGGGAFLNLGDTKCIKLTGEIWEGGPMYAGSDVVLVERITVRQGVPHARYQVGKWVR
jgi:hypothetical protein